MSAERARLFVALDLPDEVRSELLRWREMVLPATDGLRLIDPANLHVTLCFLGSQSVAEIDAILAACAGARAQSVKGLALGDVRWLPRRRPRALSVAVSDPHGALAELQAELARPLEQGGWYERESRPFFGHVTIARVRSGASLKPVPLPAPKPVPLDGAQVVLFRSRLGRGGARYEALTPEVGAKKRVVT